MRANQRSFQVIIERDEAGYFVAECPGLRACYAQGKSIDEALENIRDVIEMCLEDLRSKRKRAPVPPEIIGIMRVTVPA